MGLWLILGAMTSLALALAVVPLWRRRGPAAADREHHLGVHRAQLRELERDRELGLLDQAAFSAAKLEIERRILAAGEQAEAPSAGSRAARWLAAGVVVIGLPVLSAGLYWSLGRPDQPAAPFAGRADERVRAQAAQRSGTGGVPPVAVMIERLERRLEADPEDLEGWLRLGRARMSTERFDQAAEAYRRAIELHPGVADLHAALGEALMMASGGVVTETARAAFDRALALDPRDFRARFYGGLDLLQRGEREPALQLWSQLVREAPADAPWLPDVRRRVAGLADELGRDPEEVLPPVAETPATPSPGELEQLAARLEAEPKDWQGWIRLARGWAAAGQPRRAAEALDRGATAYEGAPFVLQQFATVAAELGLGEAQQAAAPRGPTTEQMQAAQDLAPEDRDAMIRSMVEGLAARLEEQPDDPEGWRMLGRSWGVLGEAEKSAEAYARLADMQPQDLDAQLEYAAALMALDGGDGRPPSPEAIAQLERVLALDGNQPDALFHLGRVAAQRGEVEIARDYWTRLRDQLEPGSPERAQVEAFIEGLGAGGG